MNTKMRYTERIHYLHTANNKCAFCLCLNISPWDTTRRTRRGYHFTYNVVATHFSNLVWEIPWIKEPIGLQSMGRQKNHTTEQLDSCREEIQK